MKAVRQALVGVALIATWTWTALLLAGPPESTSTFATWILGPMVLAVAYILVASAIGVLIHEVGHALVALVVGQGTVTVNLGRGRRWATLSLRSIRLNLCGPLFNGGLTRGHGITSGRQFVSFAVAGPIANLLTAALVASVWDLRASPFAATLVALSVIDGVFNLLPGPGHAESGRSDGGQIVDRLRGRGSSTSTANQPMARLVALSEAGNPDPLIDYLTRALDGALSPQTREPLLVARSMALSHAERYVDAARDAVAGKAARSTVVDSIASAMLVGDLPSDPSEVAELELALDDTSDDASDGPLAAYALTHTRAMVALLNHQPALADELLKTIPVQALPDWARPPLNGTRALTAVANNDIEVARRLLAGLRLDAPTSRWTAAAEAAVNAFGESPPNVVGRVGLEPTTDGL